MRVVCFLSAEFLTGPHLAVHPMVSWNEGAALGILCGGNHSVNFAVRSRTKRLKLFDPSTGFDMTHISRRNVHDQSPFFTGGDCSCARAASAMRLWNARVRRSVQGYVDYISAATDSRYLCAIRGIKVRQGAPANLWVCNAILELKQHVLPFADESIDVVFLVGAINFFIDRANAIRVMIRVAKLGSRILTADKTEEHVKDRCEHGTMTSGFYRKCKESVTASLDVVPPKMLEIHCRL